MIAERGGVGIHVADAGRADGPPLLLVQGLGASGRAWHRLLPHLEPHARLLVVDNRGTGLSDRIRSPVMLPDLALDLVAVLDAAEVESAHVLGLSLGGMVALHLALDHRPRVRSLVLGCTTAGGPIGRRPPPWRLVAAGALGRWRGPDDAWEVLVPALYGPVARREQRDRIAEDRATTEADATPPATVLAQLAAAAAHDVRHRLAELAGLPTTVVHGDADGVVPPADGRELAAGIPGARLVMIPGCGHMLTTEAEALLAQTVLAHL
jgi:3-oxoadipate enol-lactonase